MQGIVLELHRAEIMAGFINAIFIIFIAFFEAIERLVEPPEVKAAVQVVLVSILGLPANLIIFIFKPIDPEQGHSHVGDESYGLSQGRKSPRCNKGKKHGHSHRSMIDKP